MSPRSTTRCADGSRARRAFRAFVTDTSAWLREHHASVDDVEHVILDRHGFEEVVLRLDPDDAAVDLPIAVVADRQPDGRIDELRIYFSSQPLTGRHASRAPLLQPEPGVLGSDVVAEYLRAFAAGDVGAIVAAFEPDGSASWPGGDRGTHRGPDGLSAFYGRAVLPRRRHPARDLCPGRRRTRVRPGVQRRAVGYDAPAAAGRSRCLRPGSERQARVGPGVRRRRSAARSRLVVGRDHRDHHPAGASAAARRSQPWKDERSPASQASRSPGALRSQSGRISRLASRRSCQRSTTEGRPQNQ